GINQDGPTDATVQDATKGTPEPDHLPSLVVAATSDIGGVWLFDLPVDSIDSITPGGLKTIDVMASAGTIGFAADIETQATGQTVHTLARVGTTIYAASWDGQSWTAWAHVADDILAIGLANLDGQPVACLVGTNGHLRLADRQASGGWEDLGDVMTEATSAPEAP